MKPARKIVKPSLKEIVHQLDTAIQPPLIVSEFDNATGMNCIIEYAADARGVTTDDIIEESDFDRFTRD